MARPRRMKSRLYRAMEFQEDNLRLECKFVSDYTSGDQKCIIDIYAQPLNGISADEYILFSNKKILEQKYGVKLAAHNRKPVKGIKAQRVAVHAPWR